MRVRGAGTREAEARRPGRSYRVYLALVVALVAGAPVVRMLLIALSEPAAADWLISWSPAAPWLASGVLAVAYWSGTVRGPALLDPFPTATLASNAVPRRRSLRPPLVSAATGVVVSASAAGALLSGGLLLGGAIAGGQAALLLAGMTAVGAAAAVLWLAGQAGAWRFALGAWIVVTLAGAAAVRAWASGPAVVVVALLAAVVIVGALLAPRMLGSLHGAALLQQSLRRESSAIAFSTGEVSAAGAAYRERPAAGRRLTAVVDAPAPVAAFIRDLVGVLRRPASSAAGAVGLISAVALIAAVAGTPPGLAWLPAVAGSVLAYLALGTFTHGFAHAADTAAAPAIYGTSVAEQFGQHSLLPILLVVIVAGLGGADALGVCLSLIAVRAHESAKGALPPVLLTPMPTEMGDLSVLARLTWQLDGPLLAATIGGGGALLFAVGLPVVGFAGLAVACIVLAALTVRRLRA